ncbi:MAG: hypothetical protein ACLTXL_06375 [Clostridia bacterium]
MMKRPDAERTSRIGSFAVLTGQGCKDPDYVMYKLGDTVTFEESGGLKDKDTCWNPAKRITQPCLKQNAPVIPVVLAIFRGSTAAISP